MIAAQLAVRMVCQDRVLVQALARCSFCDRFRALTRTHGKRTVLPRVRYTHVSATYLPIAGPQIGEYFSSLYGRGTRSCGDRALPAGWPARPPDGH